MNKATFHPLDHVRSTTPKLREPPHVGASYVEGIRWLFEAIRWLIETLVLSRLEAIMGQIKRLDSPGAISNNDLRRAIRLPEVLLVLGISKSTLYDRMNPKSCRYDSAVPRPFKLGNSERSPSVWWHHDVVAYLKSHADQQRNN